MNNITIPLTHLSDAERNEAVEFITRLLKLPDTGRPFSPSYRPPMHVRPVAPMHRVGEARFDTERDAENFARHGARDYPAIARAYAEFLRVFDVARARVKRAAA